MRTNDNWAKDLVGHELHGRYRLEKLVGEGGMGAVFSALTLDTSERCAVKLIAPKLAMQPEFLKRFEREALAASAVGVRGVAEARAFDTDPALGPYLVMELLDGESLSERIKTVGAIPASKCVRILQSLLETLQAVHDQRIIHRDLKPGNVFLVGDTDEVKVLDFGVSRMREVGKDTLLTLPGTVLGTPRYTAPEQLADPTSVDARADIYGAGAIMYTCLAGRPPFAYLRGPELIRAVAKGAPSPLEKIKPGLPRALYEVVSTAMARSSTDRWQSASAMAAALGNLYEVHHPDVADWDEEEPTSRWDPTSGEPLPPTRRSSPGAKVANSPQRPPTAQPRASKPIAKTSLLQSGVDLPFLGDAASSPSPSAAPSPSSTSPGFAPASQPAPPVAGPGGAQLSVPGAPSSNPAAVGTSIPPGSHPPLSTSGSDMHLEMQVNLPSKRKGRSKAAILGLGVGAMFVLAALGVAAFMFFGPGGAWVSEEAAGSATAPSEADQSTLDEASSLVAMGSYDAASERYEAILADGCGERLSVEARGCGMAQLGLATIQITQLEPLVEQESPTPETILARVELQSKALDHYAQATNSGHLDIIQCAFAGEGELEELIGRTQDEANRATSTRLGLDFFRRGAELDVEGPCRDRAIAGAARLANAAD
ncbi:MAG: protein kinase [Myxococcota bacterium]